MKRPNPTSTNRRSYADRDLKLLWGLAAARCSKPDCRALVVADPTPKDRHAIIGEIAHIVSHKDSGPRANSRYPRADRDKYENLILLCSNHHTLVDQQDSTYTAAELRQWKQDHERWVAAQLREAVPGVGFAELEVVTRALVNTAGSPSEDFTVLSPDEKMHRNGLTDRVRFVLMLGLSKAQEVERFLVHIGHLDPDFPERLKTGFLGEYRRLREAGVVGDALFEALATFAGGGRSDFKLQAAGRIVLAYLFEKCEVFER